MVRTDHIATIRRYLETGEDLDSHSAGELNQLSITDIERELNLRQQVSARGSEFSIRPFPTSYSEQLNGECFLQSLLLSINAEITYVEGFALSPLGKLAHHHAWCEDADGIVDCTWMNTGLAYVGIRFSGDYILGEWEKRRGNLDAKYSLLSE